MTTVRDDLLAALEPIWRLYHSQVHTRITGPRSCRDARCQAATAAIERARSVPEELSTQCPCCGHKWTEKLNP